MLKRLMIAFSITGMLGVSAIASAAPYPQPTPLTITNADNGQSINLLAGRHVTVSLDSTDWIIDSSHYQSVLDRLSQPRYYTDPNAPAGSGKGKVVEHLKADKAGQVTLSAHRDVCGEAMRCDPVQDFQVAITVHYQE